MIRRCLPLLALVILVGGCTQYSGRTDRARGIAMHPDGRMLSQTDEHMREVHAAHLVEDLRAAAKQRDAAVRVEIADLPLYRESAHADRESGEWTYDDAAVSVTLGPDVALDPARASEITRAFFEPKMQWPHRDLDQRLTIEVKRAETAAGIVGAGHRPAVGPDGNRRYVVQAGDTLADLSAAFYGSSQYWRVIADANPGIGPELEPGVELVIPPLAQ